MTLSESWIPLDIDAEEPAIPVRPGPGQNVVGMVATPSARERGWAARAAVEVCRGWAQDGSRVLLCDVAFEAPELHEVAGLYNQEGVSDALMYGSSFRRLGQPLADGFFLATAGTAVPDPAALRSHPRWADFAGGFTEAGAVMVLYLPSDAPGLEALYELCDTVVVLGGRSEVDGLNLSTALGPLAVFGPHPDAGADPEDDAEDPIFHQDFVPVSDADELVAVADPAAAGLDGGEDGEPVGSDGVDALPTPAADAAETSAPMTPGPEPVAAGVESRPSASDGGGRNPVVWGVAALAALVVVLGLLGILPFPGGGGAAVEEGGPAAPPPAVAQGGGEEATPEPAESTSSDAPAPGVVRGPVGLEAAPVARFALAVASYESLSAAFADVVALRSALPEAQFIISPVLVNGRVWYRMSAGSAATAEEIVELRNRLALRRPEAAEWRVRDAGMGYLVDEYSDFQQADERVALLAEQDVPGHILRYRAADGTDRFRVYAGAYGSAVEARYLGEFLQDASPALRGLSLVERRGSRPE